MSSRYPQLSSGNTRYVSDPYINLCVYVLSGTTFSFRCHEANDNFRKGVMYNNEKAQSHSAMLASYIYSDPGVSERLTQGQKP
jgi:hypothetical protein